MKFEEDHPYIIKLDEALKQYSVVKVADGNEAHHGEDFKEMKQVILDSFFLDYKNGLHLFHLLQTVIKKRTVTENDRITGEKKSI
tara:strand:- start:386 stop:640 length:255 start_codon:yes stop_codon:yes gene_type:complete